MQFSHRRNLCESHNWLSSEIPRTDFSYNELAGEIPESVVLMNQDEKSFNGNLDLFFRNFKCAHFEYMLGPTSEAPPPIAGGLAKVANPRQRWPTLTSTKRGLIGPSKGR
ncbi:hypothetical protein NL676_021162 [Syzygium grande]|nr:hypothetical protein NL676_021162 [Syzygium grande]